MSKMEKVNPGWLNYEAEGKEWSVVTDAAKKVGSRDEDFPRWH